MCFSWWNESCRVEIPLILQELESKFSSVDLFMIGTPSSEKDLKNIGLYTKKSLKLNFPIFSLDNKKYKKSFFEHDTTPFWKVMKELYPTINTESHGFTTLLVINKNDEIVYMSNINDKGDKNPDMTVDNDINFIKKII